MKKTICLFLAVIICLSAPTFTSSALNDYNNVSSEDSSTTSSNFVVTSLSNGQVMNVLNGEALEFVTNYEINYSSPAVSQYCDGTEKCYPSGVTLTWDAQDEPQYYVLKLSVNEDMSEAISRVTFDESVTIEDLFMNTQYYYQIYACYANVIIKSRIFSFSTAYQPRTIYIDGGSNVRDIGGYVGLDGKQVKQGIVYRGAQPEDFTAEGLDKMENLLGIKTDLDLRGHNTTPFGENVELVSVSAPMYVNYYGIHWTTEGYYEALSTALHVFVEEENFPVYIHCTLGRDRTGTLAFLLNALCGVSLEDLYLDYEMAYMSRWGSTSWNTNGAPAPKMGQFTRMIDYITTGKSYLDTQHDENGYPVTQIEITNPYFTDELKDATLAEQVEAYLLSHFSSERVAELGYDESLVITQEDINAIRANLLEE